jgi:hypothetical protein
MWALVSLIAFTSFASSQNPREPFKVDTYDGRLPDTEKIVAKTQAFLSRLASEAVSTHGAIVFYYRQERDVDCFDGGISADKETEELVRKTISIDPTIDINRITYVPGHIQGHDEVEFWIVPPEAKVPAAGDRDYDPVCCCPTIKLVGLPSVHAGTKTIRFFLWMTAAPSLAQTKFKWTVSNGKVISGQGTKDVTVELNRGEVSEVKATVEAELTTWCSCPTSDSYTTKIIR